MEGENNGGPAQCAVEPRSAANSSSALPDTHAGNPIQVVTGNKYQQEVDLAPLPGVLGLAFRRHYNSNSAIVALWGPTDPHRKSRPTFPVPPP